MKYFQTKLLFTYLIITVLFSSYIGDDKTGYYVVV